jgi:hypothetical protein
VKDDRKGTFTTSAAGKPANTSYPVDTSESHGATHLYAAPEVRFGRRFGEHFEINVGVTLRVLAALSQPSWQDVNQTLEGPANASGDGLGGFNAGGTPQTLSGPFVFDAEPGLGARYTF